jgi:hypothetical protein
VVPCLYRRHNPFTRVVTLRRSCRILQYMVKDSKGDTVTPWTTLPAGQVPTPSNSLAPLRLRGHCLTFRVAGAAAPLEVSRARREGCNATDISSYLYVSE